ncbi:MAG: glucosamine-6-phosphate deaminase [Actinomycetota bacterium]|nr:glucosamine-6-phosphate deaminase [Actinomycetota bacterium]
MSPPTTSEPAGRRRAGLLDVNVYASRREAGVAAARLVEDVVADRLDGQELVRIVFASAPSQLELLAALRESTRVPWSRVVAFHMDEYVGLPGDAPERFSAFLSRELFDAVAPLVVHLLDPSDPEAECRRYEALLREAPIDLVCCGIGENGHLAFNEPGDSSFVDARWLRVVPLGEVSRQQQVNDGCFATIAEVPTDAVTMTIPALLSARRIVGVVPGASKAAAVARVLAGPIGEDCPATVLRGHDAATLFVDDAACGDAP